MKLLISGDNCIYANIQMEISRYSDTLDTSLKRKIFIILSKQSIFRAYLLLLESTFST